MVGATKLAAVVVGATAVLATKCSLDTKCPQDSPCCSQYGECGLGAYCLGGCDPRSSFSLDSCAPAPVCKSSTTRFNSLSSVVDIQDYLGDASKADWVSQGEAAVHDGSVLLTMPKKSVGTVLASTSYMWYGNVKARLKTSRGKGVVTAFILLSDVKDEIDYEFVGADLTTAQTNYYFQGVPDYNNAGNASDLSDTFQNFHDYEIRWTPDEIEWRVDGKMVRNRLRKDTWNETSQQWQFPQTPARVQLSIWPGGLASNSEGTKKWAGGEINWDDDDVKQVGYFYATLSDVSIECYDAKRAPGTHSGRSYTYSNGRGTNDTVVDGNKGTVLGSLEASGLDMDKGKKEATLSSSSSSSSATKSAATPKNTVKTIPGGSMTGAQGQDHSGQHADSSDSGGESQDSGDTGTGRDDCDTKSFKQHCGGGRVSAGSHQVGTSDGARAGLSGSALALVVASVGLLSW
ncbi:hypothetical protein CDD82_5319 [Ophiocordyceps australis]|uniref:Crh-like protein n=1 Tax=Ophiocordyceps australis TaxID=1399860 RepID=A0A2C5XIK0_9HYPO|nr:hypothetical protein CDD82_5319 [Ophiocordyceps australis]